MLLNWLSTRLAAYLSKQITRHSVRTSTWEALAQTLQPGDILLVEGNTRVSVAIKYLTQATAPTLFDVCTPANPGITFNKGVSKGSCNENWHDRIGLALPGERYGG